MSAIKHSDIIDFDGFLRSWDKMIQANDRYEKSAVKTFETVKGEVNELISTVNTLVASLKGVNTKSPGAGGAVSGIGKDLEKTIAAIDRYNALLAIAADRDQIAKASIAELEKVLSALTAEYKSLKPEMEGFTQRQKVLSEQVKAVTSVMNAQTTVLKVAKKTVDEYGGSYNKLSRETADLKAQLRAMPGAINLTTGAINKNNAQAVLWHAQIVQNDKALKAFDASIGNHQRNVGNYSSAMKGLGLTLRGALTTFFGATSAFEALSSSLEIIDKFTRLRLGLEAVSESSQQLTTRFNFITSLADKTGQKIGQLTDNYVAFSAATKNTALEGKVGDKVFQSFSNSFAALGKSSEVAERGLYAVQQMISKGKVSSEELNQQLAEALPGANKIFADALKVSTAELSNMLKEGKVASEDVLPKVAAALERLYGERAQNNLKTIGGSFNRVTNQISLLLDQLNKDSAISNFFSTFNNGIADTIKGLTRLIEKEGLAKAALSGVAVLLDPFGSAGKYLGGKIAGTTGQSLRDNAREGKMLDEFKNDDVQGRVARLNIELNKLANAKTKLASMDSKDTVVRGREYKKEEQFIKDQTRFVEDLILANKDLITVETAAAYKKTKSTGGGAGGDGDDKEKKRELNAWEKLIKEAEKYRDIIANQIVANFNSGKALEISPKAKSDWDVMYAKLVAISTALGDDIPKGLREINDALHPKTVSTPALLASRGSVSQLGRPANKDGSSAGNPITDATSKLVGVPNLISAQGAEMSHLKTQLDTGKFSRYLDAQKQAVISQLANIHDLEIQAQFASTDAERKGIEDRIILAKDELARKKEIIKTEVEARKEVQKQLFNLAVEASNAAFTILSDQNAAKIEQNRATMEHELSLVKGNAAAEDKIKDTYAKRDLELRRKQAKLDKAQAIFSIGLSTAQAIASALKTFPVPLGIALAVIAGAMGAVQLAAVAAKPLPQFWTGTENAPEGPAHIAERGSEIVESRGKMRLHERKGITFLNQGDKVYNADRTKDMLERGTVEKLTSRTKSNNSAIDAIGVAQIIIASGKKAPAIDYDKMAGAFAKALDDRPQLITEFNERGVMTRHKKKDSTTIYLDNRMRM